MITIDQYNRNGLLALFNSAAPHIQNQHNAVCEIMNISTLIANEAQKMQSKRKHLSILAIVLPFILLYSIGLITIYLLLRISGLHFEHPFVISLILTTLFYVLFLLFEEFIYQVNYRLSRNHYNKMYDQALLESQEIIQYVRNNTSQHAELQIIPFAYQNPDVLGVVYNYLINYRASTWQEAINLYEQERQLNIINKNLLQNQYLLQQETNILKGIRDDINFNSLAILGLGVFT